MSSAFFRQTWSQTRLGTNLFLSLWVTGKAPYLALSYWHNPAILGLTFRDKFLSLKRTNKWSPAGFGIC